MDIADVRVFLAVVAEKTFLGAAQRLNKQQSTVSVAIKRLEDALGVLLFSRRGRLRPSLTPAGQDLFDATAHLVREWDNVAHRIRQGVDDAGKGQLRIGAYPSALHLLPPVVKRFVAAHPEVEVTLYTQDLNETIKTLNDGSIDLAIRPPANRLPSRLEFREINSVHRVVIAARDHPIAKQRLLRESDLSGHSWIMPGREAPIRRHLESKLRDFRVALESTDIMLTKRLVMAGVGLSVVPQICIEPSDHKTLKVLAFDRQLFEADAYGIITNRKMEMSAPARAFCTMLAASFS